MLTHENIFVWLRPTIAKNFSAENPTNKLTVICPLGAKTDRRLRAGRRLRAPFSPHPLRRKFRVFVCEQPTTGAKSAFLFAP
jgi:hypothetical protein